MTEPVKLIITKAGIEAALNAEVNGIVIELHKVKFSTANFTSVMNDPRTTLPNVVYESAIAAGGTSIGQNTLRCHAVVDSPTLLNIASVGLFTADGILFAVASAPTGELLKILPNISFIMSFGMTLQAALLDNIKVVVDPTAALAAALIYQHEKHINPHPQYATDLDVLALAEAVEDRIVKVQALLATKTALEQSVSYLLSELGIHKSAPNPHPQYLLASTFGVQILMNATVNTAIKPANRVYNWNGESGDADFGIDSITWWKYYNGTVTFTPYRSFGKFLLYVNYQPQGFGELWIRTYDKTKKLLKNVQVANINRAGYNQWEDPIKHVFELPEEGYAEIYYNGRVWNKHKGSIKGSIYVDDRVKRFVPVSYSSIVDGSNFVKGRVEAEETDYSIFPAFEWFYFEVNRNEYLQVRLGTLAAPVNEVPHFHRKVMAARDTELWVLAEVGKQAPGGAYVAVEQQLLRAGSDENGIAITQIPLSMRDIALNDEERMVFKIAYYTNAKTAKLGVFPNDYVGGIQTNYVKP